MSYSEDAEVMKQKRDQLQSKVDAITASFDLQQHDETERLSLLFSLLPQMVLYTPDGGRTAWDAILGNGADSQGVALAFQLLAERLEIGSSVVAGTLDGQPHVWNRLSADGGTHYVDLTRENTGTTWSAEDLLSLGYLWDDAPIQQK